MHSIFVEYFCDIYKSNGEEELQHVRINVKIKKNKNIRNRHLKHEWKLHGSDR